MANDSHIRNGREPQPQADAIGDRGAADNARSGRVGRWLAWGFALAAIGVVVGFGLFLRQVNAQMPADPAAFEADGVVVLTGGRARLEPAVDLLRRMDGARLLVSGVNADLSLETLRRTLGVDEALFDCCIDVDRQAQDTVGNAQYTADWARNHDFDRLVVVTNDYHMPRALMEMRRALPDVMLVPFAVINRPHDDAGWSAVRDRYRVLIGEYGKFLIALARLS